MEKYLAELWHKRKTKIENVKTRIGKKMSMKKRKTISLLPTTFAAAVSIQVFTSQYCCSPQHFLLHHHCSYRRRYLLSRASGYFISHMNCVRIVPKSFLFNKLNRLLPEGLHHLVATNSFPATSGNGVVVVVAIGVKVSLRWSHFLIIGAPLHTLASFLMPFCNLRWFLERD